jgi:hypothetical protein
MRWSWGDILSLYVERDRERDVYGEKPVKSLLTDGDKWNHYRSNALTRQPAYNKMIWVSQSITLPFSIAVSPKCNGVG